MRNRTAVAWIFLLPLTGCSFILSGTSQQVEFTSEPSGAAFMVDGQKVQTPVKLTLPKSNQRLVFSKDGCDDSVYELKTKVCPYFYGSLLLVVATGVDLITGAWREFESDKVHVQLRPKPGSSVDREVSVTSDPPGATITIGGLSYGTTPGKFRLRWAAAESEKEVVLKLAGYEDQRVALRWESPTAVVNMAAKPESMSVKFDSTPAGAEVWVNRVLLGTTPTTAKYDWMAKSPSKQVEFRLDGYARETRELTKAVPHLDVKLKEAKETVALRIESDPPGASIEIDGAFAGVTPSDVPLEWSVKSIKRHSLRIVRAGYWREEVQVDETRKNEAVTVKLRPLIPTLP